MRIYNISMDIACVNSEISRVRLGRAAPYRSTQVTPRFLPYRHLVGAENGTHGCCPFIVTMLLSHDHAYAQTKTRVLTFSTSAWSYFTVPGDLTLSLSPERVCWSSLGIDSSSEEVPRAAFGRTAGSSKDRSLSRSVLCAFNRPAPVIYHIPVYITSVNKHAIGFLLEESASEMTDDFSDTSSYQSMLSEDDSEHEGSDFRPQRRSSGLTSIQSHLQHFTLFGSGSTVKSSISKKHHARDRSNNNGPSSKRGRGSVSSIDETPVRHTWLTDDLKSKFMDATRPVEHMSDVHANGNLITKSASFPFPQENVNKVTSEYQYPSSQQANTTPIRHDTMPRHQSIPQSFVDNGIQPRIMHPQTLSIPASAFQTVSPTSALPSLSHMPPTPSVFSIPPLSSASNSAFSTPFQSAYSTPQSSAYNTPRSTKWPEGGSSSGNPFEGSATSNLYLPQLQQLANQQNNSRNPSPRSPTPVEQQMQQQQQQLQQQQQQIQMQQQQIQQMQMQQQQQQQQAESPSSRGFYIRDRNSVRISTGTYSKAAKLLGENSPNSVRGQSSPHESFYPMDKVSGGSYHKAAQLLGTLPPFPISPSHLQMSTKDTDTEGSHAMEGDKTFDYQFYQQNSNETEDREASNSLEASVASNVPANRILPPPRIISNIHLVLTAPAAELPTVEDYVNHYVAQIRAQTYCTVLPIADGLKKEDTKINCPFGGGCAKKIKGKGNLRRHMEWHLRKIEEEIRRKFMALLSGMATQEPNNAQGWLSKKLGRPVTMPAR
ncbi:hypothetical protein PROFUN_14631 [Planoprotostelium fungivorum]|uniref:Uncharacterized protein n=1 Tax=Planoprotostelium fungivorum TaxID=1890364 RepID=A0A2P6N960_9EUKA|nr:hypothetical protein PROFUN_14631 [Planoprotostelium fungivorum]